MAEFTVAPLKDDDVDEAMELLRRTFFLDEPLIKALGLYDDGNCPELEDICQQTMLEGLSFKAVDSEGKIVGICINGVVPIWQDFVTAEEKCENPKFKKILDIVVRREAGHKLWEKYPDEKNAVEIKVAATDPAWRNKGIMNAIMDETEKLVKQKGIKLLRMDTSSAYSAMAAERKGFTQVYNAKYTDITLNGDPLIIPEPPHIYDRVYAKEMF